MGGSFWEKLGNLVKEVTLGGTGNPHCYYLKEKYSRTKLALCKFGQNSTQPNIHVVLVLPFISTIVLLANTLNCIDPLWMHIPNCRWNR